VKNQTLSPEKVHSSPISLDSLPRLTMLAALCAVLAATHPLAAQEKPSSEGTAGKQEQSGAGLFLNAEASVKDVGLPLYPGARPQIDKEGDKPSAKFGLWGNAFAFKLAVLKLQSSDPMDKMAAFYKKALAKYGTVLDCSITPPAASDKGNSGSSKQLDCGSDKPQPGTMEFKAGCAPQKMRTSVVTLLSFVG
jgi:hypothetical protein